MPKDHPDHDEPPTHPTEPELKRLQSLKRKLEDTLPYNTSQGRKRAKQQAIQQAAKTNFQPKKNAKIPRGLFSPSESSSDQPTRGHNDEAVTADVPKRATSKKPPHSKVQGAQGREPVPVQRPAQNQPGLQTNSPEEKAAPRAEKKIVKQHDDRPQDERTLEARAKRAQKNRRKRLRKRKEKLKGDPVVDTLLQGSVSRE